MRVSWYVAVATFSTVVLSQGFSEQIPQCAQACFSNNLGSCAVDDIACICGNTAVIDKVSCCIFATCPQSDIAATTQLAAQLCKLKNVDVNTAPSCVSSSATSPAGNSTASATASATASNTPTASATSTGAAPLQTAGAVGLGFGLVLAGWLVTL